ncbi:MAG: hypothetical protein FWE03_05055 [Firmicutes bacterium]|nr:hypothetical protein [Bacillota bacterium]
MKRANQDLRDEIKSAGLTLWQIGMAWRGINEMSTVRRFRFELSDAEKIQVREAIKKLTAQSQNSKM